MVYICQGLKYVFENPESPKVKSCKTTNMYPITLHLLIELSLKMPGLSFQPVQLDPTL